LHDSSMFQTMSEVISREKEEREEREEDKNIGK
jgi:hypothetical protein